MKRLQNYRTIYAPVTANLVEKKSEFLATITPVTTSAEAEKEIEAARVLHRKARHHVYAYRLRDGNITRYSDDGEPQGTAGLPVLDVLQKRDLVDVCCVVTRYFGGILLGANGLVRAYSTAAARAAEAAQICEMRLALPIRVTVAYPFYGAISATLAEESLSNLSAEFTDSVTIHFLVEVSNWVRLRDEIVALSNGTAQFSIGTETYADFAKSCDRNDGRNMK